MNKFDNIVGKMAIPGIFITIFWGATFSADVSDNKYTKFSAVWLISMFFVFLWAYSSNVRIIKSEEIKNKATADKSIANQAYHAIKNKINIPADAMEVNCKRETGILSLGLYYMWLSDGNLCFFPKDFPQTSDMVIKTVKCNQIALKDIEYFISQGEVYRETRISGGGGGGSSLGGAVIGGVIAGEAGAIIGSRKAGTPITSTLVTHDEREVILYYYDYGVTKELGFQVDSLRAFEKLIPDKAYEVVTQIKRMNIFKNHGNEVKPVPTPENARVFLTPEKLKTFSTPDNLRELSILHDEGILTDVEFENKRKELLAQMN